MESRLKSNSLFGVPIYDGELHGFDEVQEELIRVIMELKSKDTGLTRSNKGGWHSSDQLHQIPEPLLQSVLKNLIVESEKCMQHSKSIPPHSEVIFSSCWANCNEAGDWNAPHEHLNSDWSGVFYVKADELPSESRKSDMDGNLIFINPLTLGPQHQRDATVTAKVKTGKFFLFPSYLVHMVAPHFGPEIRLSIAYNFKIRSIK